jgi:small basic protein
MTSSDWVTILGTGATITSVVVAGYALWRQLAVLRRQMAIQRLPPRVHDPRCTLADLGPSDAVMPAIRSFFATCFEEWYLHERGFFDQGMWDMWRLGMHNALAKSAVREAWEIITSDTHYPQAFRAFVAAEAATAQAAAKK